MNAIMEGWFSEVNDMWEGMCLSLKIKEVIHTEKSPYQEIMVLQTYNKGKILVLGGIIQCCEFDEFAYQEMISYIPICSHPNPKSVLVVGGGDGGVARELAKHPTIETIDMVEIDERVIEVSKKYLPNMAIGFECPKLRLHIGDGVEYVKQHKNEFDIIITDSSDPIGPAAALFKQEYYESLKDALKPGGIICSQAGSMWSNPEIAKQLFDIGRKIFERCAFACVNVPTYPTGQIGLLLCSTTKETRFKHPVCVFDDAELEKRKFRYYNAEVHASAFVLPNQFNCLFQPPPSICNTT